MGNHEKALHYAQRHLEISREVTNRIINECVRQELFIIIDRAEKKENVFADPKPWGIFYLMSPKMLF